MVEREEMKYCDVCKRDTFRSINGMCLTCKSYNIDKLIKTNEGLSLVKWNRHHGMVIEIDARFLIKYHDIYYISTMIHRQVPNSDQMAPYFSLNGYYISVYNDAMEIYLIKE